MSVREKQHHLVLATVLLLLAGSFAVVALLVHRHRGADFGDEVNLISVYVTLFGTVVPILTALIPWWWKKSTGDQPQKPIRKPPTVKPKKTSPTIGRTTVTIDNRRRQSSRQWLSKARRQAATPLAIIVAAAAGTAVEIVTRLLGLTPGEAAVTALITAPLSYLMYVIVMTATAVSDAQEAAGA